MSDTIKLGNLEISSFKVGSTDVDKIYLGSTLLYPSTPQHDYSKDYLTFEVVKVGTVTFKGSTNGGKVISYKVNDGEWTSLTSTTSEQTLGGILSVGDKVLVKGNNASYGSREYYHCFGGTAKVNVEGNIMSLIDGDNFDGSVTLTSSRALQHLFHGYTNLLSAENLILPATSLSSYCYSYMFYGCSSLTTAPELPATTLTYQCYYYMFEYCTSLTTAPELPATTLTDSCYSGMFGGCTNLTTAPELPATTLASSCYNNMFSKCSNLKYVTCLATDTSATNCTTNWLNGVSSTGTFTKAASMTSWPRTQNGIPAKWTVKNYSS